MAGNTVASNFDVVREVVYSPAWGSTWQRTAKRFFDLVGSVLLLVLLAPLLLALAIAVKVSSPGPILYRWKVVGRLGRPFVSYKFRSMVADADQLKPSLQKFNEMRGPMFKISHDPRVTRLGAWMRKYSLDELPQLYSVLLGQMSLVGPRPPLQTEYVHFADHQKQKLAVKPGMTCLWQVRGRNAVAYFDDWVALDLEYIRTWSLWLDCKILLRTAGEMVRGSGK